MTTTDTALQTSHRRARVVQLRRERRTWDAIGADIGVSKQRAHKIYQEALAEYPISALGEHRAEEGELIDQAIRDLLAIAADDREYENADGVSKPVVSPRTRVEAWSAIRGWSEHRARLYGLNAPTRTQVDVVTRDSLATELERLAAELGPGAGVLDATVVEDDGEGTDPREDHSGVRALGAGPSA